MADRSFGCVAGMGLALLLLGGAMATAGGFMAFVALEPLLQQAGNALPLWASLPATLASAFSNLVVGWWFVVLPLVLLPLFALGRVAPKVGFALPAGVGAARHRAKVRPGDSVLVVGVGGDGMNVVQGARLAGAATIVAADVVAHKLDWARAFGATHTIDAGREDLVAAVHALTDGVGVDHAFVCIDPPRTLLPAFRATAKAGNVVVTALTPADELSLPVPPLELVTSQKAIMGSVYGFASPRVQIPELVALYRQGAIRLSELVTRRYPLDAINDGYADLIAGRNLRGVVLPFA